MKRMPINIGSDEFELKEIFDTDYGTGVDIYHNNKYIGVMYGVSLPDVDDDDEYWVNLKIIENELEDFLNSINFY